MNSPADKLLIPAEFYFQATMEIPYQQDLRQEIEQKSHPEIPTVLPNLMFDRAGQQEPLEVRIAWNDDGLGLQLNVRGKEHPVSLFDDSPHDGDHFVFFFDTRDLKTVYRPSRFCHRFCLFPPGEEAKRPARVFQEMVGMRTPDDTLASSSEIPVFATRSGNDYCVSCWIDRTWLHGFDPENAPTLGYFHLLQDEEFGERLFAVGEKFPVTNNPSLWPSLKLTRS